MICLHILRHPLKDQYFASRKATWLTNWLYLLFQLPEPFLSCVIILNTLSWKQAVVITIWNYVVEISQFAWVESFRNWNTALVCFDPAGGNLNVEASFQCISSAELGIVHVNRHCTQVSLIQQPGLHMQKLFLKCLKSACRRASEFSLCRFPAKKLIFTHLGAQ